MVLAQQRYKTMASLHMDGRMPKLQDFIGWDLERLRTELSESDTVVEKTKAELNRSRVEGPQPGIYGAPGSCERQKQNWLDKIDYQTQKLAFWTENSSLVRVAIRSMTESGDKSFQG